MTLDLICLLILALWSIPLNHIPALARVAHSDITWGMGNRDKMPDVPPWVGRADRAQRNHHDNLAMIAIVILIAHLTNQNDSVTAFASIAIAVLRILHSLVYIFGITGIRSAAYFGAILALFVIIWRIFS
ncbi:MAPEG family protein [Nostoc sp. CHAB 5844]|nr:MAPEG family protein [Nostoc sp. CHAB 5844]